MSGPPQCETSGTLVKFTYTAYHFEHCKSTIVEYTKDLIVQNQAKGINISREAVNAAFEANVKSVFPEGHPMRQELLQQMRCPIIMYYWTKYLRPAAFLMYMKDDTTTLSVLHRSPDDIARNIMALLDGNGRRIEIPYLGLRSLQQIQYMDLVLKVFVPNRNLGNPTGWSSAGQDTVHYVWNKIVEEIFWFEDHDLKHDKTLEVFSREVVDYWKLLEYGEFVKSQKPMEHNTSINAGKSLGHVGVPVRHRMSKSQKSTGPNTSISAGKDLGHIEVQVPLGTASPQPQAARTIRPAVSRLKPSSATSRPSEMDLSGYSPSESTLTERQVAQLQDELYKLRNEVDGYRAMATARGPNETGFFGYFPSVTTLTEPQVTQLKDEAFRLRKEVKEYKATVSDLSTRLSDPQSAQDKAELLRLRDEVKEYKSMVSDLSTRLVKAKQIEAQNMKRWTRFADEVATSDVPKGRQRQNPDAPATENLNLKPTTLPAVSQTQNQYPATVDPSNWMTNPLDLRTPVAQQQQQQQQHEQYLQGIQQQQGHFYAQQPWMQEPFLWQGQPYDYTSNPAVP